MHLDILPGLPHGFLSFSTVGFEIFEVSHVAFFIHLTHPFFQFQLSKEAHEGSKICIKRVSELLGINLDTEDGKVRIFC